ncbi:MAG: hypothetical protein IJ892_07000, partial [Prevotella sp.]|nr:hypothetical protein [Prevotella sp.]
EREAPQREKGHAFQVGSGRGHDWQRPLPMMAANAANDGSGRCQPKFTSDDERLLMNGYCLLVNGYCSTVID